MRSRRAALPAFLLALLACGTAEAQTAEPVRPGLTAPRVVASGVDVHLRATDAPPGSRVVLERRLEGAWVRVGAATADSGGRAALRYAPRGERVRSYRLRARVSGGLASASRWVRVRDVTLAAAGDVNLGHPVEPVLRARGDRFPWTGVAPTLRRADIAFANLECAVSRRGRRVPKQYNFRGRPAALRAAVDVAGLDVLNLANNHAGDFGRTALLDTIRHVRRSGAVDVGAGRNLAGAHTPRIVRRLGLRIAFVGFSDIGPFSFGAGPSRPGTALASPGAVRRGIARAARRADVVIATFHWGIERDTRPSARQRQLARVALRAGATAVIGAHPHVLQPVVRAGRRRVVAYSLGNFVWGAGSALTSRTGILLLRLSARGVEGSRLLPARIEGTRPRLLR